MITNNKKASIWSKMIDITRHYLYVIIYLVAIITYSINFCFVFYILKRIKLLNNICTKILNIMLMKFQSIVKCAMLIGGMDLYVYKEKDIDLIFNKNVVIIPNHLSELDSMFIGALYNDIFPQFYKVITFAKNTIRFYPFIGWITLAHDTIFVQNKNTSPNFNQHNYIENKLKNENNNNFNKNIIIFIEGTTFSKKVKQTRELFNGSISYNNLLIPKTNGLHMIHSNIDIDGEIYLTLKFEGDYKIEDYTIAGLLKGIKPKSIHIFVDTKPYEKKNNQQLLLDREKYNEEVYKNFKTIDDKLNNNISFWKNNYDSKKLGITFYDIIYFTIFLMSFVYTFKGLSYSWLYRIYFTIVPIVYLICGFIEV